MPLPAKHFYMIRHGETQANRDRMMAGSLDSPLTDLGIQQAEKARDIIVTLDVKPSVIVHSDLSRARDTASIINKGLNIPQIEEPDIAELHAGDWEGVPYEECEELLHGWPTPPNGESFEEFCTRLQRGKITHLEKNENPILIVSHGGVFRGLGGIFGLQTPGTFKNCHLYEFVPHNENKRFLWDVFTHDAIGTRVATDVYNDDTLYSASKIA